MDTVKIPLFPLGVVLLPHMMLPLHIFEDRYKQMIAECLAQQQSFGIVLFDGQSIHTVGCTARIDGTLKRYDDGRMDIMVQGGERFVIRELTEDRAYLEARVFFFDDTQTVSAENNLEEVIEAGMKLLEEVAGLDVGLDPSRPAGAINPKQLSYVIAAQEGFTPVERQGILEMTSPSERLRKCVQALSRIVVRNRLTREIQKTIGGNGQPPRSILKELEDQAEKGVVF